MINPKTFLENGAPIEFEVIAKSGKKAIFTTSARKSENRYRLTTCGNYIGASVVVYSIDEQSTVEKTWESVPQKISEVISKLLVKDKSKLMQIETSK